MQNLRHPPREDGGAAGYCYRRCYCVLVVLLGVLLDDDVPELDWSVVPPLVAPELLGALELVLPGVLELPLGVLEDEGAPDEGLVLELEPAEDLSLSLSMEPEAELEDEDGEVLEPLEDGVELEPADEDELGEDGVVAEPPADELPVAEREDEAPVALSPPPPLSQP